VARRRNGDPIFRGEVYGGIVLNLFLHPPSGVVIEFISMTASILASSTRLQTKQAAMLT
jgi:hypothetical protein